MSSANGGVAGHQYGGPLTASDLEMLKRSGISAETAQQAQLRRVGAHEGGEIVGRGGRNGWQSQSADYSGIIFPYIWPGDHVVREYRLRRDHPDYVMQPDGTEKQEGKYLNAPGCGNMLYMAPSTDPAWLQDIELPVMIVEGEKKCLSLSELAWRRGGDSTEEPEWLAIGVSGVRNWFGKVGKRTEADGKQRDVKGPIADLKKVKWRGRKVTILYDSNVESNKNVSFARWELSRHLRGQGARVQWFTWPKTTPEDVNGIDDLIGRWGWEKVLETLDAFSKAAPLSLEAIESAPREFLRISEEHYTLDLPALGVKFDLNRLRRERNELIGELSIESKFPGIRTYDGVFSAGDFSVSSLYTRKQRAKDFSEQAPQINWRDLLEELCQRVLKADREIEPLINLATVPMPRSNPWVWAEQVALLESAPNSLFGDGGAGKSYVMLVLAKALIEKGHRVALFDFEWDQDAHRRRLGWLFGEQVPELYYRRLNRSMVREADGIEKRCRQDRITFAFFDSISGACEGAPESAEMANNYYRAVRRLEFGTVHSAHIPKNTEEQHRGTVEKMFGSTMWNNLIRSHWSVKGQHSEQNPSILEVRLDHQKVNDKRWGPRGIEFEFFENEQGETERAEYRWREAPQLREAPQSGGVADKDASIRQRMIADLKTGARAIKDLADRVEASEESVGRTARRYRNEDFIVLKDGRIALRYK